MQRIIIEGYSAESAQAALSDALHKGAHYFSENWDVSMMLRELIDLPDGGHRAVIEIRLTPMTFRDRIHPDSLDVETKRFRDRAFRQDLLAEARRAKHLVYEHFAVSRGTNVPEIPDYFLVDITEAKLLNYMLERQFFKAGHSADPDESQAGPDPDPEMPPPSPRPFLVKVKRPAPKIEEED